MGEEPGFSATVTEQDRRADRAGKVYGAFMKLLPLGLPALFLIHRGSEEGNTPNLIEIGFGWDAKSGKVHPGLLFLEGQNEGGYSLEVGGGKMHGVRLPSSRSLPLGAVEAMREELPKQLSATRGEDEPK